jgi:hypothetical protein
VGLTGRVYKIKECIYKNQNDALPIQYITEIDNALKFQGISNFLFCPIIGKTGDCTGVIHLYNKLNDEVIDKYDIVDI